MSQRGRGTLGTAVILLLAASLPQAGASAGDAVPWSVTATPTIGITDGQTIAITVKTTPDFPIYAAEAHVCRAGVAYQGSTSPHIRPNHDFDIGGANCPLTPISSSADTSAVASTSLYASSTSPDGEVFTFRSGTGVVNWASPTGPRSLTCDADHACSLVVELQGGPGTPTWFPVVIPLTYHDDDPISGCGGPAAGIVASGGSDRLFDAWVGWTLGACGAAGAPTRASFDGEGEAVHAFTDGTIDLAYTGLGADAEATLAPGDGSRAALAVPVALNAAVLAVGNGKPGLNGRKVPYSDIKLTLDEVTALLSGGQFGIESYLPAIYARNPELASTGFFDTSSPFVAGAGASADAISLFTTARVHTQRASIWRVPDIPSVFGSDAGRARSTHASLALADPGFQNALTLLTGRPALQRNLSGLGGTDFGGIWMLTDLATATALGLTPVQIEDGRGDYIAPTPDTLAAAVPTLLRTPGGALRPDPSAGGTAGAYPLTFVEYALAPAEPLIDAACVTRPASQALLEGFLAHVGGPGQTELPPGFVALPPSLRDEAAATATGVGAAEVTGPCAGRVTEPSGEPLAPPLVPSAATGDPTGPGSPSSSLRFAAAGSRADAGVTPGTVNSVKRRGGGPAAALAEIAAQRHLGASGGVDPLWAMAALVGMTLLISWSVVSTAGRLRRSGAPVVSAAGPAVALGEPTPSAP